MPFEPESPAVSDPALTPREVAARRLLALRALETMLKTTTATLRREAEAAFTKAGQREVAELPDGTPLGNVRADAGKAAGWAVTDPGRFLAWVQATCPDAVVEKVVTTSEVEPEYAALVLDALTKTGAHVDQSTGEEVGGGPPGVTYVPAGKPKLVVTGAADAPAAVAALLGGTLGRLGITS